jgi:sugar phosphate isomerase/epimerase
MLYSTNTSFVINRPEIELMKGIEMFIDAGFPALDISLFKYDFATSDDRDATAKKLKALAESRGVIFNQAHAPFGGGFDKYTTETVPNFPRIFEFCGILGVKNIVVHPLQRGRYYGQEEVLFELNMDFYSKLAPYAKNAGIKIAIENMWHNDPHNGRIVDDTCADPHELVRYYDTLNDPDAFTICLDLGHVGICGREPEDAIKIIGLDKLGAIHAHDVDYVSDLHTLPGLGKLNYDAVCRSLAEIDYSGEFTLESEYFAKNFPDEHLPAVLKFMSETAKLYADRIEKYKKERV